jgi:hypothetical protein
MDKQNTSDRLPKKCDRSDRSLETANPNSSHYPLPDNLERHLDYQRLEKAFQHVHTIKSTWKRRAALCWIAPYVGIPRAEFRKLFELWSIEQLSDSGIAKGGNDV